MYGLDHWQAYELSWLNVRGKPEVAIGEFYFNSESENIVESKSLKLYLNSLNQERYKSAEAVRSIIEQDLSAISRSEVKVMLHALDEIEIDPLGGQGRQIHRSIWIVEIEIHQPDAQLLESGQ